MIALFKNVSLAMAVFLIICADGYAGLGDFFKSFTGASTSELEEMRPYAMSIILPYDYKTCYENTEKVLKNMPKTTIFAKSSGMIAVYYADPNETPVGVFFTAVDATHTKVEVSSTAMEAKKWVALNVFSEKAQPAKPESRFVDSKPKDSRW